MFELARPTSLAAGFKRELRCNLRLKLATPLERYGFFVCSGATGNFS